MGIFYLVREKMISCVLEEEGCLAQVRREDRDEDGGAGRYLSQPNYLTQGRKDGCSSVVGSEDLY